MEGREVILKLHKAGIEVSVCNNNLVFSTSPNDELMSQVIKYKNEIRNLVSRYGWPVIWRTCLIEQESLERGSLEFIKHRKTDRCALCLIEKKVQGHQLCSICITAFIIHCQIDAVYKVASRFGINPNNIQQVIFLPPKR